jgi:hypothetical protein
VLKMKHKPPSVEDKIRAHIFGSITSFAQTLTGQITDLPQHPSPEEDANWSMGDGRYYNSSLITMLYICAQDFAKSLGTPIENEILFITAFFIYNLTMKSEKETFNFLGQYFQTIAGIEAQVSDNNENITRLEKALEPISKMVLPATEEYQKYFDKWPSVHDIEKLPATAARTLSQAQAALTEMLRLLGDLQLPLGGGARDRHIANTQSELINKYFTAVSRQGKWVNPYDTVKEFCPEITTAKDPQWVETPLTAPRSWAETFANMAQNGRQLFAAGS